MELQIEKSKEQGTNSCPHPAHILQTACGIHMHDNVSHYKKSCNKRPLSVRPLLYNEAHI
jgi:hypothetical protein